jgi:hypothetical protein
VLSRADVVLLGLSLDGPAGSLLGRCYEERGNIKGKGRRKRGVGFVGRKEKVAPLKRFLQSQLSFLKTIRLLRKTRNNDTIIIDLRDLKTRKKINLPV